MSIINALRPDTHLLTLNRCCQENVKMEWEDVKIEEN